MCEVLAYMPWKLKEISNFLQHKAGEKKNLVEGLEEAEKI